jgi:hypothetical protein
MKIVEGKPQPAPLDQVELSPAEVFTALHNYVVTHTGRTPREIVGFDQIYSLGVKDPALQITLTLKPKE